MNSMPQQAVTNGKGKNEYFLPQLMTLLSFVVMALVPNIVSSPIWAPFFYSKSSHSHNRVPGFPRAHECRQRVASWQAASERIDPEWQADEVFVGYGEEEQGRKHIEQPCRRHQPVVDKHFAFAQDAGHVARQRPTTFLQDERQQKHIFSPAREKREETQRGNPRTYLW